MEHFRFSECWFVCFEYSIKDCLSRKPVSNMWSTVWGLLSRGSASDSAKKSTRANVHWCHDKQRTYILFVYANYSFLSKQRDHSENHIFLTSSPVSNRGNKLETSVSILLKYFTVSLCETHEFRGSFTHWGRDEMDISQTIYSNVFSSMKMFDLWLKFHSSLFLCVQITIFQHCFR